MLTNEQCDEFRCHPDDFYSRVRAVYDLGRKHALEDAAKKLEREKKTYKWVSNDGRANVLDIACELWYMSTQVNGEKDER